MPKETNLKDPCPTLRNCWQLLPIEIVREIFLRCPIRVARFESDGDYAPSSSASYEFCSPSIRYSPLNISHVCRWWREITLSTPALWASLAITDKLQDPEEAAELCSTWLSRSGALPLSLGLKSTCVTSGDGQRVEVVERVGYTMLASIVPYLPRWRKVWINIPHLSSFPPVPRGSPVMLEQIHLSASLLSGPWTPCPWTVLQHAPQLRQMTLNVLPQDYQLLTALGPWSPLRLTGTQSLMSEVQLFDTADHFPVLGNVQFSGWSVTQAIAPQPLFLPHLTYLGCKMDEEVTRILDRLILPSLTTLEIEGGGAIVERAMSLIVRSSCVLSHLSVKAPLLFEHNVIRLLSATPSLVDLCLSSFDSTSGSTDRVLTGLCNRSIIPSLKTLRLERLRDVSAACVISFLDARKGGPLESCHLAFDFVSKHTTLWNHLRAAAPMVSFTCDDTMDLSTSWSDDWGSVAVY